MLNSTRTRAQQFIERTGNRLQKQKATAREWEADQAFYRQPRADRQAVNPARAVQAARQDNGLISGSGPADRPARETRYTLRSASVLLRITVSELLAHIRANEVRATKASYGTFTLTQGQLEDARLSLTRLARAKKLAEQETAGQVAIDLDLTAK